MAPTALLHDPPGRVGAFFWARQLEQFGAKPEFIFLVACLRARLRNDPALLAEAAVPNNIDWKFFLELAARHRTTGFIGRYLDGVQEIPSEIRQSLREGASRNTKVVMFRLGELGRVIQRLQDHNLKVLTLKGPVLSCQIHRDLACRQAGDLDLLVPLEAVEESGQIIEGLGYERTIPKDRLRTSESRRFKDRCPHYTYVHRPRNVAIELHWRMISTPGLLPLDFDDLYADREEVRSGQLVFPTLSQVPMLLHLCVHGAHHGWERLSWIYDMAALQESSDLNWTGLVHAATRLGLERVIAQQAVVCHQMFGTEIPAELGELVEKQAPYLSTAAMKYAIATGGERIPWRLRRVVYRSLLVKGLNYKRNVLSEEIFQTTHLPFATLPGFLLPIYTLLRPLFWLQRKTRGASHSRGSALNAILLAASLFVWTATSAPADRAGLTDGVEKSSRPAPHRVEELASAVRGSVVVIKHLGRDGAQDGIGSGFVVSPDGLIATSLHVIGEARPMTIQFPGGRPLPVQEIRAWDRKLDLAIVKVDASGLKALPLGDAESLKQGTEIVAIGHPQGLEQSVVRGVVSAMREFDDGPLIQLAIPIEPGNSGGPALDMDGRVVGILTLKSVVTENLGFATPVNALKKLLDHPNPVPMDRWLTIGGLKPGQWKALMGARWTQRGNLVKVEGKGSGFGGRSLCLSKREVPETPYELAVQVRLKDEAGAAGLIFAADGGDAHFGFYPTAGQFRLTRFDGPDVFSWTILDQRRSRQYRPGKWNLIKVRVEKEKLLCYVNGELLIESSVIPARSGQVGLAQFRQTEAEFKDFQVGKKILDASIPEAEKAAIEEQIDRMEKGAKVRDLDRLGESPEPSRTLLFERARVLEERAAALRQAAGFVHQEWVARELKELLAKPEKEINLFRAALWIAKLDNPDLDMQACETELAGMAVEVRKAAGEKASQEQKLTALRHYLFAENGFHGSRSDYYNRANSYINDVLDDREGIPITLSVLFIELAQQIGLDGVAGIPAPGHFLVAHTPASGPVEWIDVFDQGKSLAEKDVKTLWGPLNPSSESWNRPATKREIIARMFRNLLGIAMREENIARTGAYLDIILALEPESAAERWTRAILRIQTGDTDGARLDLRWLRDKEPPGIDQNRVQELIQSL